jgi:hypothetical protein
MSCTFENVIAQLQELIQFFRNVGNGLRKLAFKMYAFGITIRIMKRGTVILPVEVQGNGFELSQAVKFNALL